MVITLSKPSVTEIALTTGVDLYPFSGSRMLLNHAAHLNAYRAAEASRSTNREATTRIMRK
jgi:hypothetical protein